MGLKKILGIGAIALALSSCSSENNLDGYTGYVDLNGDGREDKVSFVSGRSPKGGDSYYKLMARFMKEDSTYGLPKVLHEFNCEPLEFSLFDIDGDGDWDLLFAKGKSDYGKGYKVYVSYNDGKGNFGKSKEISEEFRK